MSKRETIERLRNARVILEPLLGQLPVQLEPRVNETCTLLMQLQLLVERQANTLSHDITQEGESNGI